jgi:hypothetical protein
MGAYKTRWIIIAYAVVAAALSAAALHYGSIGAGLVDRSIAHAVESGGRNPAHQESR